MNAFELADELDKILKSIGLEDNRVPTMLRKQADRIAELSKNVDELEEELLKAPQIKELSDEEIMAMAKDYIHYTEYRLAIQFARAILKKARNK
jgi:predicted nuclease with TOPRIM domain